MERASIQDDPKCVAQRGERLPHLPFLNQWSYPNEKEGWKLGKDRRDSIENMVGRERVT